MSERMSHWVEEKHHFAHAAKDQAQQKTSSTSGCEVLQWYRKNHRKNHMKNGGLPSAYLRQRTGKSFINGGFNGKIISGIVLFRICWLRHLYHWNSRWSRDSKFERIKATSEAYSKWTGWTPKYSRLLQDSSGSTMKPHAFLPRCSATRWHKRLQIFHLSDSAIRSKGHHFEMSKHLLVLYINNVIVIMIWSLDIIIIW